MDYSPRGHRELDMTEQLTQAQGGLRLGGEEAGLQGCLRQSSCYLCIPGCYENSFCSGWDFSQVSTDVSNVEDFIEEASLD